MPFHLKKSGRGYKVFSITGKPLSKKPLPKERAIKQLQAVNIHYFKK